MDIYNLVAKTLLMLKKRNDTTKMDTVFFLQQSGGFEVWLQTELSNIARDETLHNEQIREIKVESPNGRRFVDLQICTENNTHFLELKCRTKSQTSYCFSKRFWDDVVKLNKIVIDQRDTYGYVIGFAPFTRTDGKGSYRKTKSKFYFFGDDSYLDGQIEQVRNTLLGYSKKIPEYEKYQCIKGVQLYYLSVEFKKISMNPMYKDYKGIVAFFCELKNRFDDDSSETQMEIE